MADSKGSENEVVDDLNVRNDEQIFITLKEISTLVSTARLQAREAEIRARYAAEFAEKAISEAQSAHQVSETLSKTSRIVAALALEFSNKADLCIENWQYHEDDSYNQIQTILASDLSTQETDNAKSDETSTQNAPINMITSLPPLKLQPAKPEIEIADDTLTEGFMKDIVSEKMKILDIRRKISLYKDSKLINNLRTTLDGGDSVRSADVHKQGTTSDANSQADEHESR